MGDRTHVCDKLRKLNDRGEEPERRDAGAGEKARGTLTSCDPTVTAETEGDEEAVALTSATTKRMRVTSDSCGHAATAGQRLKARERSRVDESRLPVRAVKARAQERG